MMVFEGTGLKGRQEGAFPRKQLPSILIFFDPFFSGFSEIWGRGQCPLSGTNKESY